MKQKAREFNQMSNLFVAAHEMKSVQLAGSLKHIMTEEGSTASSVVPEYNDDRIVDGEMLKQLDKLHQDDAHYPKYVTSSMANSVKFLNDPSQIMGQDWFVVEDGSEKLDLSEDIECSLNWFPEATVSEDNYQKRKTYDSRNHRHSNTYDYKKQKQFHPPPRPHSSQQPYTASQPSSFQRSNPPHNNPSNNPTHSHDIHPYNHHHLSFPHKHHR